LYEAQEKVLDRQFEETSNQDKETIF